MLPGITSPQAIQLATRLTRPAPRVLGRDGKPVAFTVSVGIAECASCQDPPTLLARADAAMYQAKRTGGGNWRIFDHPELPAVGLPARALLWRYAVRQPAWGYGLPGGGWRSGGRDGSRAAAAGGHGLRRPHRVAVDTD